MKTTIIILTAIFAFQINVLFAGNAEAKSGSLKETTFTPDKELSVQAGKADRSEVTPLTEKISLAPMTPKEADFYENEDTTSVNLRSLTPVIPSEADFE